ncbi:hypothetical protein ACFFJT_06355 [Dyella flava]|uniref:CvpA family protein n=1 Tax=Dyella flava TaxID=1920170 RepID=A0ABS2K1V1_9GAMM|nr:hypothetical protein [Dyella flava]MBM7124864.1 hypothetical protein [Dyella flava]GLQ50905.1 hypothetical protein GCM10010872_23540 [Dyella flava]
MDSYLDVLKRVARVLIVAGLIDIAYMVYCIAHKQGYSSGLNIFAVIAGIFLWRGHLGAVRIVTRFTALMIAVAFGLFVFLLPMLQPTGLWLAEFEINPIRTIVGCVTVVVMFVLLIWVYRQLRVDSVVQALGRAGQPTAPPKLAFGLGAVITIFLTVVFHFTLGGSAGSKAIELAKAKYGDQYQYAPNAISWAGNHALARLTAYNEHEIKTVVVEWSD